MALDIRLDFITNIDPQYIQKMTNIRQMFIALDELLKVFADEAQAQNLPASARAVALARTNNESACQYAIKTLCILGERVVDKETSDAS